MKRAVNLCKLIEKFHSKNTFDHNLRKLKIISVANGRCEAQLKIEEGHVNKEGDLHTGLTSTLVDLVTAYALMSQIDKMHITTHIHVNIMKAAKKDDCVLLNAWVNHVDRSNAFLELEAREKETRDLLFKGTHTKIVLDVSYEGLLKKYLPE